MSETEVVKNLPEPVVFVRDGVAFTNSRDVAAFFGKEHGNVLQSIDNLLISLMTENSAMVKGFVLVEYETAMTPGRKFRSFDMSRDAFALLVMGFTGSTALAFKLRYIERFNAMEEELKKVRVNLNDPAFLRGLLADYAERVEKLEDKTRAQEAVIADQAVSVEALDRIAGSTDLYGVRETAYILQLAQNQFSRELVTRGWCHRRNASGSLQGYADKIKRGYLTHKLREYTRSDGRQGTRKDVMFTTKGITVLAEVFGVTPDFGRRTVSDD